MISPELRSVRVSSPVRNQFVARTECFDEALPEDHPARIIWNFCAKLDLSEFFREIKAVRGGAGRDSTDPHLLVSLWLYAHTRGIGSARELARRCESEDAFRWLCGYVPVNYHMLSDFRVGHAEALDKLFSQSIAVMVQEGLVTAERVSQDGTKVRVGAGCSSFHSRPTLERLLKESQEHVEALRQQSLEEDDGRSARQRAAQERAARERQERVEQALVEMQKLEEQRQKKNGKASKQPPRASVTDPESRNMKQGDGGSRPSVNVNLATDNDSRVVIGVEVSNSHTDHRKATPMRAQVLERTGRRVEEHLVDAGFQTLETVEEAAAEGVQLLMPVLKPRKLDESQRYEPRPGDSPAVAEWRKRMGTAEAQGAYRERSATIETVNGDLKTHRGLGRVLVRGIEKVRCVVLWAVMAYNLVVCGKELFS